MSPFAKTNNLNDNDCVSRWKISSRSVWKEKKKKQKNSIDKSGRSKLISIERDCCYFKCYDHTQTKSFNRNISSMSHILCTNLEWQHNFFFFFYLFIAIASSVNFRNESNADFFLPFVFICICTHICRNFCLIFHFNMNNKRKKRSSMKTEFTLFYFVFADITRYPIPESVHKSLWLIDNDIHILHAHTQKFHMIDHVARILVAANRS